MKKRIIILALLGVFALNKAQERAIEEVLIAGKVIDLPYKKSNANVTVISKMQIQNAAAKSVEEVLAYYTGMDIRKRGANGMQTDIAVRGSSFEQVLLLINGVRINDAQTGHNSMNLPFDVSSVERIEILKGPAARRFGQGAYAGVINIVTKPSSENDIAIKGVGGDFKSFSGGVSSDFGTKNFRNFIQVNHSQSDGYRYNTDYKINNAYYQNQYKIENGVLKFQAGFQEKKYGANGFYASPAYTEQYEEIQTSLVSVALEKKIMGNLGINAKTYWKRGQDLYLLNRNNPSLYRNMHIGNNVGMEVSANYKSSFGITGVGLDVRKEFLASNRLGSRERLVSQAFLEHHFSVFNDAVTVSPGVSWSSIEGENYFYPGIDIGYTEGNHKVFSNFAKVNRVPTYTDLYYVSPTEQGNPNLKPESALTGELGYQFQKEQGFVKASIFWRKTDHAIDWQKATPATPWTAQNIGTIETKGFELEANHQVVSWLGVSVGYTYLDNQRISNTVASRYALDHLKHQLVAKLRNSFEGFTHELIYRYNERVSLGSYHLLDDQVSYRFKDFNFYILVNNITNAQYVETSLVPMPGRWFHAGFTYKFKL